MSIHFLSKNSNVNINPNVFVQEIEPTIKDGIWIKTANRHISEILGDENIAGNEGWNSSSMSSFPIKIRYTEIASIENYIYVLDKKENLIYKYNIDANIFEDTIDLSNYEKTYIGMVSVNNDLYIIGTNSNSSSFKSVIKYDTITSKITLCKEIPYTYSTSNVYENGKAVAIGTDIFIFGQNKELYKYDTINDSYTNLQTLPSYGYDTQLAVIGKNIFFTRTTGFYDPSTLLYKYDIETNTFSKEADIPNEYGYISMVAVNGDIYMFGIYNSSDQTYKACYKYDTINKVFEKLENSPYIVCYSSSIAIKKDDKIDIYIICGSNSSTGSANTEIYSVNIKTYPDNSVVIQQGNNTYKTKLFLNDNVNIYYYFDDVFLNTKETGLDGSLPTYYGNGTEWIKFKN